MLELKNISKAIDNKIILKDISFKLQKGKCLCLFGPSGCGKTTILNLIAGFMMPDQGEIFINNNLVSDNKKLTAPYKRDINMVFQDLALWPHMTVYSNLEFVLNSSKKKYNKKKKREKIEDSLKLFKLNNYQKKYPNQLSGGEKQRLAIARALIIKSNFLLLDEPFSSLDKDLKIKLLDIIKTTKKKLDLSIVFVTHDLEEATFLADEIAYMGAGIIKQINNTKN
jgi:iron(III) transport system ATP-binding protein